MRLLRIGIGSTNPTVGAVRSNVDGLLRQARAMAEAGVALACFPEQAVGGYPAEDLVQWRAYVAAQRRALERFAAATSDLAAAFVLGVTADVEGDLFNCAAVVQGGRILGLVPKEKLPSYNVFYEARTLSRGSAGLSLASAGVALGDLLFEFPFGVLAVEVCEDAWSPDGPMRRRCYSGAEIVVNVSASPFRVGVVGTRREMLATRSADNQAALVYVNRVGGQDGLVFDGGGYVFQNGRLLHEGERFREGWSSVVVDLGRTHRLRVENTTWRADREAFHERAAAVARVRAAPGAAEPPAPDAYPAPAGDSFFLPPASERAAPRERVLDDLLAALTLGVRDYYAKTGAFRRIGVAVSGGRDSMLTLLVGWRVARALGEGGEAPPLQAFYMPSRHSAAATREAARTLCAELDVPLVEIAIDEAYDGEVEAAATMLGGAAEVDELTRQNVQARIRAARMWNWSNSSGALFLQTGDMSEKAVGYTTVGGDLEGGLSVIANVPKTVVVALLERLHALHGFRGIELCLATAPGPELADDQEAEAELMAFPVLDACLHLYAGEKLTPSEVAFALRAIFPERDAGALREDADRFARLFNRSIYKWVQAPLALHVGSLDLDRERALQLPVVSSAEWMQE